jgi:Ribonuclease G/E
MTAAVSADRAAASRLVAALEHAWTAIRTQHPEVPQVVIVVASGSDPTRSRRLNLGHFAAGRWQLTDPNQPTDRPEVLVSGEGLQRGPVEVLGTLLHEAAHGLAYVRKVSDTSRQGRYPQPAVCRPRSGARPGGRRPGSHRMVGHQHP